MPRSSTFRARRCRAALREHFLRGRRAVVVVAGTHGKTTTSAMCAWLLARAGLEPGCFIGGLPKRFGVGAAIGSTRSDRPRQQPAPFVVEGDEYDAVYWHKQPKFFDYVGVGADDVAIVTSIEHDHIDIYPDGERVRSGVPRLRAQRCRRGASSSATRDDARARAIVLEQAARESPRTRSSATTRATSTPSGSRPCGARWRTAQAFDLFAGGVACGRFSMARPGRAQRAQRARRDRRMAAEGFGVAREHVAAALASFEGVRRRQELLGEPGGVAVYDDFAHHPTAVDETLRALRERHPTGRSARLRAAQRDGLPRTPPGGVRARVRRGRSRPPRAARPHERARGGALDLERLARELGEKARATPSVDDIVDDVRATAKSGDVIAVLSNGAFGGIHARLLDALVTRR